MDYRETPAHNAARTHKKTAPSVHEPLSLSDDGAYGGQCVHCGCPEWAMQKPQPPQQPPPYGAQKP